MSFDLLKSRIKDSPISTVIERYVTLVRRGSSVTALCPFHNDTKPSMNVSDDKGMFKCFACGQGGDAITFVKELKKLTYIEALKEISGILGIPFEEYEKEKKKNPRVEMAYRVLNASVKIYKKVAEQDHPQYVQFIEKRKLNADSIEKYQIGYAPYGNVLLHYLETIPSPDGDFALQTAKDIGIIKYNKDRDSTYDFYRDRVMFPIHNHAGQICGYSSRAVLPDQNPKYLNSGESFAFDKSSILFGFYFGKNAIRQADQAIIVEGNMDVIMMHQFGFHQTVGTMGTALSEYSVKLISNMTKNVFLGMDSDAAGKKAMLRINSDFLALGVLPRLLNFEPAKDPDEFLLTEGRIALMERIEKAPILVDVLIEEMIPATLPDNITLKIEILQRVFAILAPLKEHLAASERIMSAAKTLKFGSDSATILQDYKVFLSRQKEKVVVVEKQRLEEVETELAEQQSIAEAQKEIPVQESGPLSKAEKVFLKEIISHPEFLTHLNRDEFLAYISHVEVKKLVHWLTKMYFEIDESEYVQMVQDELNDGGYTKEIKDLGTDALFKHGNKLNEKVMQRLLIDYQRNLKRDQLNFKKKELEELQKVAQSQNEVNHLLGEIYKIAVEISKL